MSQFSNNTPATPFLRDVEEFLVDRQARNLTPSTLRWYRHSLQIFSNFLAVHDVTTTEGITPGVLRRFLLSLTERGHNAGGVANVYCAVKAFLVWYVAESATPDWENPLKKVKSPKRPTEIEEPISMEDFRKLLATCEAKTLVGDRDRAMLLVLIDSGVRHQELTDLEMRDIDLNTGQVLVRKGKGQKARIIFVGNKTRRALFGYLKHRGQLSDADPLWITRDGTRLTRAGIREIVRRRSKQAGIHTPGLHDFRRAFAVNFLRGGGDLITLQRLLGHTSLVIINRYLDLLTSDLKAVHQRVGVVDNLL